MTLPDGKFMKGDTARRAPCVFGILTRSQCIVHIRSHTYIQLYSAACRGPMPTVDTASTVAMDRSLKGDKEMIEMLSSFPYLDSTCGESIRSKDQIMEQASVRMKLKPLK